MAAHPGPPPARGGHASLLAVVEALAEARSLDDIVSAVTRSAAALTGAREAALALFGGAEAFAVAGEDTPESPEDRIRRLEQVRDGGAPQSSGEGADAVLAVPVPGPSDAAGAVGALYVRGRDTGPFGPADHAVLDSLARTVATAVRTAHLHVESRSQQRWLTATAEIGAQLLVHTGEDPLRLIARRAFELSDADLVTISLLTDDGTAIVIEECVGPAATDVLGRRFPVRATMAGIAILERRPLLANTGDIAEHFGRHASNLRSVIDVGPLMALPLIGAERVRGSMSICRARGRAPYSDTDLALAAGFATHASVALELADSRAAEQRIVLLEDRDRIARDLHDHVIQELFAIGLSLQSVATGLGVDSGPGARIASRVEDLDRTIRRIRTSIFELRGPDRAGAVAHGGLRESALEIASDLTPALGFAPLVSVSPSVDGVALAPELHADVTAVLREGLTNVAKHAHATRVAVDIERPSGEIVVTVSDDGVGVQAGGRRSGTANLQARAERHGGTCDVSSAPAGGTLLIWRVPIR